MPLYPLLLIGVLVLAEGGFGLAADATTLRGWSAVAAVAGPIVAVLVVQRLVMAICGRLLDTRGNPRTFLLAERATRVARWALLLHFAAAVLALGWLDAVRAAIGDPVLLDELITMTPTLLGLAGTWWIYYPMERRIRQQTLIRELDAGRPLFPAPSRGGYVLTQVRTQLLLMLAPVLAIMTAWETVYAIAEQWSDRAWVPWAADAVVVAAALGIVGVAPLLIRVVLEVEPMPDGPLRDSLMAVCRQHRVKVRQLLVWNTHGAMINAAVMGLFGRVRYVLLTDALLESMYPRQLEAVMAHEIAHVHRHHLPWLGVALAASVVGISAPLLLAQPHLFGEPPPGVQAGQAGGQDVAATLVMAAATLAIFAPFGWVSRRFERQADAFAVRHVNGFVADTPGAISDEAVQVVADALGSIARLNGVHLGHWDWRHGSIAGRQAYLRSIVGCEETQLAIDRQVRWIKAAAAAVFVVGVGGVAWAVGGQM